jgi:hypothetical protein
MLFFAVIITSDSYLNLNLEELFKFIESTRALIPPLIQTKK